ncbi:unnamed protein product [Penicillium pancosmium]
MFPTRALFGQARLTLFTRAGCGLCDNAKKTVVQLHQRRPFEFVETYIDEPGNKKWKDVYDFDVPEADLSDARKLFHRMTEQEVEQLVTEAEK